MACAIRALSNVVCLSAALALVTARRATDFRDGVELAREILGSRSAYRQFEEFREIANTVSRGE